MESVVNGEKEKSLEKNIQTSSEFDNFQFGRKFSPKSGFHLEILVWGGTGRGSFTHHALYSLLPLS